MDSISLDPRVNQSSRLAVSTPPALSPTELAQQRQVVQAVQAVSQADLFGKGLELTFAMDRATKRLVVKLKDARTGEVIRQIPPEYVLKLAAELKAGHQPGLE